MIAPRLTALAALPFLVAAGPLATLAACAGNPDWAREPQEARHKAADEGWRGPADADPSRPPPPAIEVRDFDGTPRALIEEPGSDKLYRNTYYDFPHEASNDRSATVYDATCAPIAKVSKAFHDAVCVQGSGQLATGDTVSFAKRDCACASVCPRTGQKICFERLDPKVYPHGRGAAGTAITPLRSVAVDPSIIPLGTPIFVPEFVGLKRPDGRLHDGCFLAEDKGIKVVGKQIDFFTGSPDATRVYNQLVPSNQGIHVHLGEARCASLATSAPARN